MIIKKAYLLFIILFFNLVDSTSQNIQEKTYKDYIENEQVISENKLDSHASFSSFTSRFRAARAKVEIEKLLLNTFRTATLFTLSYDLLVMVSKTKKVSCRDTAPSFRNKLPEALQESQEPKELDKPKE